MLLKDYSKMTINEIIKSKMYKALLQKTYFETGNSFMGYFKYLALSTFIFNYTIGIAVNLIYLIICYQFGRIYYKKGLVIVSGEIGNQFNLFQIQLRRRMKT